VNIIISVIIRNSK